MPTIHIDFETCSLADLRKVGAYKYAQDPSTQVICMAWGFDTGPIKTWVPSRHGPMLPPFLRSEPLAAWNVSFEASILEHTLGEPRASHQFIDTMAEAAIAGLPLGLDLAAQAAGLPVGKDKVGHALMLRMSRPRRHSTNNKIDWWHEQDPDKLDRLINYCKQDVQVERAISNMVPRMTETERKVWLIDFDMNKRGVMLDDQLVTQMQAVVKSAQEKLKDQITTLTGGQVTSPSQTGKLLAWINARTVHPPKDLRRDTLENYSLGGPRTMEVVRCRLAFAKSSTAKLKAMTNCAGDDGAMRGLVQYYGAMRTGRFAGRLVQPQNMPRPTIKDTENPIAYIRAGMTANGVSTFFGDPMEVVSSCLRGTFVARPDHLLFSIDFSQIEARVLAWLAGQKDIVDAFAAGVDVYQLTAGKVGSTDRFLGKVLVLACGYQMGGPKFHETVIKMGGGMSEGEAVLAVKRWRHANRNIVMYWGRMHDWLSTHAQACTSIAPVTLKSGRVLPYRNVHFVGDGEIAYVGLNTYTHKWGDVKIYGGKLVENIVQATARDVMTDAAIRVDNMLPKAHLWLTVHDELIYEIHKDHFVNGCADTTLTTLEGFIKATPIWAKGLPIAVEGWHGRRYRK